MKYTVNEGDGRVVLKISGKVTAENVVDLAKGVSGSAKKWPDQEWILDCEGLRYISSGGLRWLLGLQRQLSRKIHLIGVQKGVMDILSMTGVDKLFPTELRIRRISLKGCERIGRGANGEVYRLADETIVKVFFPGFELEDVKREDEISHMVFQTGLPVVIPYDTVSVEDGRYGIVFETLGARSLSETIEEAPAHFDEWITEYVNLYRMIHTTDGENTGLPSAKDLYRRHLANSAEWYSEEEMAQLLRLLDSIPDRNTLVHGDYHPNNIMVCDRELILIDLGDFCVGHPVFDFLATAATQANLVDLSPEYAELHTKMKAERIRKGWSTLIEQYFREQTPSDRSRIDAQIRLFSKLKVACAPAVAKGISEELMKASVDDVKENLIPRIDELIGTIDW